MTAVLQILPRLVTGGVERGTVEITAALQAAGHRAIVVSEGGAMVQEVEATGAKHITLPVANKNPLKMYGNIARLAAIIREYKVDIIHARSRAPAWTAWAASRRTGIHFVTTFHNAYAGTSKLKRFYNSVMARGDRVIAISEFVGDYARTLFNVPPQKLRIIPRGVDTKRFDPALVGDDRVQALKKDWGLRDGVPVVLLPGRLTRWKGQSVLIEALAQLGRDDIACVIVGGGSYSYRMELEQVITQKNLKDIVRIVGDCRDMPAAYKLADITVSASTRPEGFGRVIVEAQAMGSLVIATNHGAARETIIPGETGWLVPPDAAAALAQALENALSLNPDARKAVRDAAQASIQANFTTALMTARTLAVYAELVRP